jgi:hypothetical protein
MRLLIDKKQKHKCRIFGDRIISSGIWPARLPDLNPCDFFFWGCLKDRVYSSNPLNRRTKRRHSEGNCKYSCRTSSKGKLEPLPLVRGMSTYRGTAFLIPPVISEL